MFALRCAGVSALVALAICATGLVLPPIGDATTTRSLRRRTVHRDGGVDATTGDVSATPDAVDSTAPPVVVEAIVRGNDGRCTTALPSNRCLRGDFCYEPTRRIVGCPEALRRRGPTGLDAFVERRSDGSCVLRTFLPGCRPGFRDCRHPTSTTSIPCPSALPN